MENNIDVGFDPSESKILGVIDNHVHVRGWDIEEDDPKLTEVILIIPIKEYKKCWDKWLKGKQDFCTRYGHYCGVMGNLYSSNCKEAGKINVYDYNEETEEMDEVFLNAYICKDFGETDFEHG